MRRLAGAAVAVGVLAACSSSGTPGDPDAVPGADPTTSAPGGEEPAVTGTGAPVTTEPALTPTEPESTSSSAPPAAPPAAPTSGVTVVNAGSYLGGGWTPLAIWNGANWEAPTFDETGALSSPASSFGSVSAVSLGLPAPITGLAYGATTDFFCVGDESGPTIDIGATVATLPVDAGYNAVAFAADWNVQPRAVEQVGLDAEVYRMIGESFVGAKGIDPTGGEVVQVVRADLDGNGVEEVLVVFEKITEGFGTAGDFSIIYARYPSSDGAVVDEVLFEHYPSGEDFPTLGSGALLAVADFNGDGVMEVVTTSQFWESALVELYEFSGGTLTSIAASGCSL